MPVENRTKQIFTKLKPSEYALLRAFLDARGLRLSEFVRDLVLARLAETNVQQKQSS